MCPAVGMLDARQGRFRVTVAPLVCLVALKTAPRLIAFAPLSVRSWNRSSGLPLIRPLLKSRMDTGQGLYVGRYRSGHRGPLRGTFH